MSSKGRKEVEEDEFYPTERWVVECLLESDQVRLPPGMWIDPCAGSGRIVSTVNQYRSVSWMICEINERFDEHLRPLVRDNRDQILPYGDFVHRHWPYPTADVLIMNPPFSLTLQFVKAAFMRALWVVCLQRKNWFGTQERSSWLQQYCPDDYTLPERPSFRPDGKTDSCEYSWFVWPPGNRRRRSGKVAMLEMPKGGQQELFALN